MPGQRFNKQRGQRPRKQRLFLKTENRRYTNHRPNQRNTMDKTIKIVIGRKRVWIFNNMGYRVALDDQLELEIVRTYENRLGKVIVIRPFTKRNEDELEFDTADWV